MPLLLQNKHILTKPKMTYFDEQRAITLEGMVLLWTTMELEEDIIILNNVTTFHKIQIKTFLPKELKTVV